jgi:mono/diheme cytochrome c family protein
MKTTIHTLRIAVLALGALAFATTAAQAADAAKLEQGHQVFLKWCAPCHGPGIGNGGAPYLPGTQALKTKYQGKLPMLLEERTDLTPEFVKVIVRNGITIMPFTRKTEVSDAELDALAGWLTRNSK